MLRVFLGMIRRKSSSAGRCGGRALIVGFAVFAAIATLALVVGLVLGIKGLMRIYTVNF